MKYTKILYLIIFLTGCLALGELTLRVGLGLGSPPLYIHSDSFEYILAPDQKLFRFRNLISTNELSMRSDPVDYSACPSILFVGDSVINGGALTDQSDLATVLIQNKIRLNGYPNTQVLNVSAGSWGPDNASAFLSEHPTLSPDLIIGVWSSHDAGDEMAHIPIVGKHPSYPEHNPTTAFGELITRYLLPRINYLDNYLQEESTSSEFKNTEQHNLHQLNPGWENMLIYANFHEIPLIIYLHAEKEELIQGKYHQEGKKILDWSKKSKVSVFRGIDHIKNPGVYRDNIHLNKSGQHELAETLTPLLLDVVKKRELNCINAQN